LHRTDVFAGQLKRVYMLISCKFDAYVLGWNDNTWHNMSIQ
jgi:hypothetical protein